MTDIVHARGTAAVEIFRRDLIASLERGIAANEKALAALSHVLLGQAYVVRSAHGIVLDFTIDAQGRVSDPRPTSPAAAPRFDIATATHLAQACGDGTGQPFEAVHVNHALKEAIATDQRLIGELKAGAKPSEAEKIVQKS